MSKKTYPYPEDEFDQVDLTTRPKEVHAAKRSTWSRVWPFLLVVVLVPAVAFAAVKVLASSSSPPAAEPTSTVAPTDATTDQPPAQTPAETIPEQTEEPVTQPQPAPEPEPEPEPEPPAEPDFAMKVTVYNDTSDDFAGNQLGLARRAADLLTSLGFTQADISQDHIIQDGRPDSMIYYPSPEAAATADAVAQAVGITAPPIEDPQTAPDGIVVSLGDDFTE
ncbi:MAG: LytR C-terminal domain-containing protein [Micrococcales bacterium]|nr:LytR C-terminal domain-containing protein [Micrococcales bacterium]